MNNPPLDWNKPLANKAGWKDIKVHVTDLAGAYPVLVTYVGSNGQRCFDEFTSEGWYDQLPYSKYDDRNLFNPPENKTVECWVVLWKRGNSSLFYSQPSTDWLNRWKEDVHSITHLIKTDVKEGDGL